MTVDAKVTVGEWRDAAQTSQELCSCGHREGAHEAIHGACIAPNCECAEFTARVR